MKKALIGFVFAGFVVVRLFGIAPEPVTFYCVEDTVDIIGDTSVMKCETRDGSMMTWNLNAIPAIEVKGNLEEN